MTIAIILGIGLVTRLLAGMLGIGGGVIMIPGMVILAGIDQHMAQGISLAVIVATTLVGSITHHRQGNVDVRVAAWIAPSAVIFALIGAYLAGLIGSLWLSRAWGLLLVYFGLEMVLGRSPWRLVLRRESGREC